MQEAFPYCSTTVDRLWNIGYHKSDVLTEINPDQLGIEGHNYEQNLQIIVKKS